MNIEIDFTPSWTFRFKDLLVRDDELVMISGSAQAYSAILTNDFMKNHKEYGGFSLGSIERIPPEEIRIDSFMYLGEEAMPWNYSTCKRWEYDISEKLMEIIAESVDTTGNANAL
tara:strand:- start:309 stop:653 length:345 start_codon:yes stop_codon:yes gene_type:complete